MCSRIHCSSMRYTLTYLLYNAFSHIWQVSRWQRKLGNVDLTINVWLEVQKKWSNLQSIFSGSGDIRIQLPEDSKRF